MTARLVASGGTGGYVYAITGGAVPAGTGPVNAATGAIPGTPTTISHYEFVGMVQDSSSTVYSATFAIDVVSRLTVIAGTPVIGEIGRPYNYTLRVSGATGTVTWAKISGTISAGIALSSAGVLSGTPTSPDGTSYAVVRATDAGSGDTLDIPIAITIAPALAISSIDERVATGVSVTIPLNITGGVAPYTATVRDTGSGEPLLPPGLRIGRRHYAIGEIPDGRLAISGIPGPPETPSTNGNQDYLRTIDITDALGAVATTAMRISVLGNPYTLGTAINGTPLANRSAVNYDFVGPAVLSATSTSDKTTVEIGAPDSAGLSVLGRAANTTGQAQDIPATTADRVLARVGMALQWTQVTPAMLVSGLAAPTTSVYGLNGAWVTSVSGPWGAASFTVGGTQVVGARNTGWGAPSGLAVKTAWTIYASPGTISSTYSSTVAGQLTTALLALEQAHRRIAAMELALTNHGLIGP